MLIYDYTCQIAIYKTGYLLQSAYIALSEERTHSDASDFQPEAGQNHFSLPYLGFWDRVINQAIGERLETKSSKLSRKCAVIRLDKFAL